MSEKLISYRFDKAQNEAERLQEFLRGYGWPDDQDLPIRKEDGMVDIVKLAESLPEHLNNGIDDNGAYYELVSYVRALPPILRAKGIFRDPEKLQLMLMERLEFFEQLMRNLVRTCSGKECPQYSICPFKEQVAEVQRSDGIPCAWEREVVQKQVDAYVKPDENGKTVVDPKRPEIASLFFQLVQLLVLQTRIMLYLKTQDIMVDAMDKFRDDTGAEHPGKLGEIDHPLVERWIKVTNQIMRLMNEMGITPKFQIQQDVWVDDEDRLDAEKRGRELALQYVSRAGKELISQLPENAPGREHILKLTEDAEKAAKEAHKES